MRKPLLILGVIVLGLYGCSEAERPKNPEYKTPLSSRETRTIAFKDQFPEHWESFQRNSQASELEAMKTMTTYKGSIPFNKHDDQHPLPEGFAQGAQPYLKNLWLGYPFSWEYTEARGHTYAIQDVMHSDRINQYSDKAGMPATCWNCKTPTIAHWVEEYGDDKFWSMDFNDFRTTEFIDAMQESVSCATCHNPENMELALYSAPLKEYLDRTGQDFDTLSRNEKRSLVCAQCHVEYHFSDPAHGPDKKPVFPWDLGKDPEQMYTYYEDKGRQNPDGTFAQFYDWIHPVSNTPMLKAQHPEYETWSNGPHGAAGVSCADCHMPYMRMDGRKKISSHMWTSPLRNDELIDITCRQCHADKTPTYLRERVEYTQDKAYQQLIIAQDMSVRAHEAIRLAAEWNGYKGASYENHMAEAREMVRKGQFFWDLVSAENSVGFHNPQQALDTLASSQRYSQKAVDAAMAATNYEIGKALEGDIRQIVPPIMYWSREMQMSRENLDAHVWTSYLPLQPKGERVWHGQKMIQK